MAQCLRGDRGAFGELVERHQRAVFALIAARIGRRPEVEDLAQEAFLKAYESLRSLRDASRFGGWVLKIASNMALRWRERESRAPVTQTLGEPEQKPGPGASDREEDPAAEIPIMPYLGKLREADQQVVVLRYVQDLSFDDIAIQLSISTGNARVRLHRAIRKLRALLKEEQRL